MANHKIVDQIDARLKAVEGSFQARSSGASFCQLQKDGRVTGGAKYDEGWMVALMAARRLVQACPAGDREARAGALQAEQNTWARALAVQQAKERPSLPWTAYYQGGADALAWVLENLSAPSC